MKIVQALEYSNILLERVTKTIKNEKKEQKGEFLSMLLGTLELACQEFFIIRERNCKSWLWNRMGFFMPVHPLANFEIQKYYQNEPRFNGFFSRDNMTKTIKDGVYIINLDEYADAGTHQLITTKENEIKQFG